MGPLGRRRQRQIERRERRRKQKFPGSVTVPSRYKPRDHMDYLVVMGPTQRLVKKHVVKEDESKDPPVRLHKSPEARLEWKSRRDLQRFLRGRRKR